MSDQKYDVVFSGEIQDGFDVDGVKENFAQVFRLPPEKVARFFGPSRVVLKGNVDHKTAEKYQSVLSKTGAVVTIEARQQEGSPPPVPAGKADPAPQAAPDPPVPGGQNIGPADKEGASGSLEGGMAGNYRFSVGDTLSEAWQKVNGNKATTLLAVLLYVAIMIVLGIVTGLVTAVLTAVAGDTGSAIGGLLAQIVQIVVTAPLNAGIFMLGASMAVGSPAGVGSILGYFDRILPLALTAILYSVLIMVGFLLLIIPGIYLSVAYVLALPLVADKGLSPWQALEASRKALTRRWFSVFGLFLVMGLLYLVGAIPLLIGWIWIIPLGLIALGILYRNIFGVSSIVAE